jgi:hypothetical protein
MEQKTKTLISALLLAITIVSLVTASGVLTAQTAASQVPEAANLLWERNFGGAGDDRAFAARPIQDGYIVAGSSTSNEQNRTHAWVIRLDSEGNAVWNRTFSQADSIGSEFRCVLSLSDGFLLVGNAFLSSGGTVGYLVKIDIEGNPLWSTTVNMCAGVNKLFSAQRTDSGFVLVGLAGQSDGGGNSDVWLVETDADGNVVCNRTFGSSADEAGRAVAYIKNDGYVVAGYSDMGDGNYDFLLLKIDASGNVLWKKTYGGAQSDKAYAMIATSDACIVAGDTRSQGNGESDAWIIKVDLNGNMLWEKTVGGEGFDAPTCVTVAPDGGYAIGGTTFSFGSGQRDFWLFKLNVAGEVLWSRTVGRSGYEESYAVVALANDKFFMAGWTNSLGEGRYDFYVVKLSV